MSPHDSDVTFDAPSTPTDDGKTVASEVPVIIAPDGLAPAGYEILHELGRGAMGVVYLARSLSLKRTVALKMILSGSYAGEGEVTRFRAEAEAVARLQHPGIVQVFEVGENDGRPFMALEYCGGGSLDAILAKNPLPPRDAAALVRKLAEAVQAAHEAKVIHRDLKPANVLLTEKGEPKVTDFGLAKRLDDGGATRTGSVIGSPSYMPPEQAEGKKDVGPPADIYALGAILYECLASRPPFRAPTALDTILQVMTEEPVPVRQLNRLAPLDLETIAHRCLQKDPKKRYASAQDLADDLSRYLAGEPIRARPVGAAERAVKWVRRNAVVSVLAAGVLLALTAGVAVSSRFAYAAGEEAKSARIAEKQAEDQLRRAEWSVYAGKLLLALAAFNENNVPDALRHLEECQWDLRGWEYAHLRRRFDGSKQTLKGHTGVVNGVAFSPDGRRVLTGSGDHTARVWDAEKGTEILAFRGHAGNVNSVAWSPDGRRVLTGSLDKTAKLWDAEGGTEVLALRGHTKPVLSVAWSPDGRRVLTGGYDGTARLWDARRGTELLALRGHTQTVSSVAFSPDGRRVLTGGYDKTARLWDAGRGTELLVFRGHAGYVYSVAFSPDGRRVLTGGYDKSARVWDAERGTELLALGGHALPVLTVAWSPDGRRFLTGSGDRTAKVWEAENGTEVLALKGHAGYVYSVAFSPDCKRVLTGSGEVGKPGEAKVWEVENGTEVLALKGHAGNVSGVAWSPDGKRVLTGSGEVEKPGEATVWEAERGTEALALKGHAGVVTGLAFSPDGKRIFAWDESDMVLAWTTTDGKPADTSGPPTKVVGSAKSPDGRFVAKPDGSRVLVVDLLQPTPAGDPWPFPDAAERKAHHSARADLAEKSNHHFAAAFHLGRLLFDAPKDAALLARRDAALKAHAASAVARPPARMERVP